MSMHTDIVYGYGFCVYAADEQLAAFIKNHAQAVRECCDYGSDIVRLVETDVENIKEAELLLSLKCNLSGSCGPYAVVANVISHETGLGIQFEPGGEDDDYTIMLAFCAPWNYNGKEKELTSEKLRDILTPYMRELGMKSSEPDYVQVEYYG